jgi:ribosomal protein S18 acetylase RimI-like enzyme
MEITIAALKDVDSIMVLFSSCIKEMEENSIYQWDDKYPTQEKIERDINNQSLFLFKIDRKLAGTVTLDGNQPPEYGDVDWKYKAQKVLVVHRLAVNPVFQNRGTAKKLMDFVQQYGRTHGYEVVRLDAFIKNPAAIALYEHRGYRKAGTVIFRKGLFYCFESNL